MRYMRLSRLPREINFNTKYRSADCFFNGNSRYFSLEGIMHIAIPLKFNVIISDYFDLIVLLIIFAVIF